MKVFAYFLIALFALTSLSCFNPIFGYKNENKKTDNELFKLFQNFIKDFEVNYNNLDELMKRFEIFKENLKLTENQYNQFSDLTQKEFADTYLTLRVNFVDYVRKEPLKFSSNTQEVPEKFDWREKNAVTPVKNQGQCGSCWAFSTVANIESISAIKRGKLEIYSEQQVVDCDTNDHGCGGGWQEKAFDYVLKQGGLEHDSDYKYIQKQSTCKFDETKIAVKIQSFSFVTQDEEELKQALIENGPLSAALNAQMLQYYIGGIFYPKWPFTCDPKLLNHAVLLVGYGEEKGKKYWVVKNSWGARWGESGYFRILRGVGECGINSHVLTAILE